MHSALLFVCALALPILSLGANVICHGSLPVLAAGEYQATGAAGCDPRQAGVAATCASIDANRCYPGSWDLSAASCDSPSSGSNSCAGAGMAKRAELGEWKRETETFSSCTQMPLFPGIAESIARHGPLPDAEMSVDFNYYADTLAACKASLSSLCEGEVQASLLKGVPPHCSRWMECVKDQAESDICANYPYPSPGSYCDNAVRRREETYGDILRAAALSPNVNGTHYRNQHGKWMKRAIESVTGCSGSSAPTMAATRPDAGFTTNPSAASTTTTTTTASPGGTSISIRKRSMESLELQVGLLQTAVAGDEGQIVMDDRVNVWRKNEDGTTSWKFDVYNTTKRDTECMGPFFDGQYCVVVDACAVHTLMTEIVMCGPSFTTKHTCAINPSNGDLHPKYAQWCLL